jgi:sterol desaturase/sphingolipid hydroxylase (fatty acid hydroxylase superfamily)
MPENMSPLLILLAVPLFLATFCGEGWLRRRRGMSFDVADGVTSVGMGAAFLVINLLASGLIVALIQVLYEHRLWDLGGGAWVWGLALVADDLVFYWAHRTSHEVRFFWATHEAHHSSEQYTLTTALRQPWTEPIAVVFWFPLPLLGLPPQMLLTVHTANLIYQYWIHTELVGRLGILEWILNTPSHHRVHHGSNPRYLDRNHGGIFIVWDRLFGTFEPETEPPVYGLTNPLVKRGAVHASFHEWLGILRDLRRARTWRGRMTALFGRTGTDYLACERKPAAR